MTGQLLLFNAARRAGKGSPAEQLVEVLTECRREGISFRTAWGEAYRSITWPAEDKDARQWRCALKWARAEFQSAYEDPRSQSPAWTGINEARRGLEHDDLLVAA